MKSQCVVPSYRTAIAFLAEPSVQTAMPLIWNFAGRTAILSTAFLLVKQPPVESVYLGLVGSSAIEVFLLFDAYDAVSRRKCK